jgi:hypothetical protein
MVRAQPRVARIVSGGQTGVDRAALETARILSLPIGGWCPAGGWAEDLTEPPGVRALFPELQETPSDDPAERTEWNVRDSDLTLVLTRGGARSVGTDATTACAVRLERPHLVVDVGEVALVDGWLRQHGRGLVLNVAGPRESEAPGIGRDARATLLALGDVFTGEVGSG